VTGKQKRPNFTPEHIAGVAEVLRRYPGSATTGFPAAVRALRETLGCEDEAPAIHFVPDAYRINHEACDIEIFEVEVTHPVTFQKLYELGDYWFEWDAESGHDWLPVLIQIDRFGTHHRRDLSVAYHFAAQVPA
jgi:hypothetical protein